MLGKKGEQAKEKLTTNLFWSKSTHIHITETEKPSLSLSRYTLSVVHHTPGHRRSVSDLVAVWQKKVNGIALSFIYYQSIQKNKI